MSKRPTDDLLLAKLDAVEASFEPLKADLARIRLLLPLVREHRLRDYHPPVVGMECKRPEPIRKAPEPPPEPKDLKVLLFLLGSLDQLDKALQRFAIVRRMLAERLPAKDAALDKRKLEEEADLGSRPVAEGACIVCGNVVDRIRRGMCPSDYESWRNAGGPDLGTWLPARRRFLESQEAA